MHRFFLYNLQFVAIILFLQSWAIAHEVITFIYFLLTLYSLVTLAISQLEYSIS